LDQWIKKEKIALLFLGAISVYYENMAFFHQNKQCALSVVLPNKAKKIFRIPWFEK